MASPSEPGGSRSTLIVGGGDRPGGAVARRVDQLWAEGRIGACVAADGGADHARAFGWPVDVVVGDLDSITPETLALLGEVGATVDAYRPDKDQTDLELALGRAIDDGADSLVVVGVGGGRVDHELANLSVLAGTARRGVAVEILAGTARLVPIVGRYRLATRVGETVSLLAILGDVAGVTTEGLQYPLSDEPLAAGTARGVSNVAMGDEVVVGVRSGVLLVVQPDGLDQHS